MSKAVVFAGTSEGYELCRFLSAHQVAVHACMATGYGGRVLEQQEGLYVHSKRMDAEEMEELFKSEKPDLVLDATHPYADLVTENIRRACEKTHVPCWRVLRGQGEKSRDGVYTDTIEEAVDFLKGTKGNILLTTGSKDLAAFTKLPDYKERLFARVLSLPQVLDTCRTLGIEGRHLIGMQGPFSMEMNVAMLRQFHCAYLVTKDSGDAGGFQEKIDAALTCGAVPVIIGRPSREEGRSLSQCKKDLAGYFKFQIKPHITLLGIGMGSRDTLTIEGERRLKEADLLIGASRMVKAVQLPHHQVFCEYRPEKILGYIREHPEYENVVIALSGDVGFYSGARRLLEILGKDTEVICGISSVAYFMAKAGLSWDDAVLKSVHGRSSNLIPLIRQNQKVFAILGTKDGVGCLARELCDFGMGEVTLYVGENLSYEDENIFFRPAKELTAYEGEALSVVCAYNREALPMHATHGVPDREFQRGKTPMTKEEVRAVSLMKLALCQDSICYDVGAGTGSVSVEMALRAHQGWVYAIEKKDEAAELIRKNKVKFAASNLEIIEGTAPEALRSLPAPTHAFIGGSSGKLEEIVGLLLEKNPQVRIVINCITLETVAEGIKMMKKYGFLETDIVQLAVSRGKAAGPYHLMMGENPIYILTCQYPGGSQEQEDA
ncbi:MAG TPA: precorrin-6A reductase [Candidatus Blautia faecigallinarum]|uniref:Precorrin-6A reductase n=1 Tax=Candidatus Blautia faecigallinarum TaxID=2838488 RepID=A0A9D2DRJ5_9FIRM|nr:precorrin-6A reductase [Candidatus Blautia faecigallinarum]